MHNCPRCSGFIVCDYINPGGEEGNRPLRAVRCVNCGFLADSLILSRWFHYQMASVDNVTE